MGGVRVERGGLYSGYLESDTPMPLRISSLYYNEGSAITLTIVVYHESE